MIKPPLPVGETLKKVDEGNRMEYHLTDKGWDLMPVLLAMTHWGDKHVPAEEVERVVFVDRKSGRTIEPMSIHDADG